MRYLVFASLLLVGIGISSWDGIALPTTKALGKLVTRQQASELHEFYAAMASVVSSGAIDTTSEFRNTQILAAKIMQESIGPSASLAEINQPINKMLIDAIGVDGEVPDADIDPEMRVKLVDVLREISEDF